MNRGNTKSIRKSEKQFSVNDPINGLSAIEHWADHNLQLCIIVCLLQQSVHNVVVLLSVLQCVLTVNTLSAQSWQKLNSSSIISVKINVVNLSIQTRVANSKVNVVNVLSVLMEIFSLNHVGFIEFSQSVFETGENIIKNASDSQFFAVVF